MRCRRIIMGQCCMILTVAVLATASGVSGALLRARCPPSARQNCIKNDNYINFNTFYKVNGKHMNIYFQDGHLFKLSCNKNEPDVAALPRFDQEVTVQKVILYSCPPPAVSYAELLAALNVSAPRDLELQYVPGLPPLRAAHFYNLSLDTLIITADKNASQRLDGEFLQLLDNGPKKLILHYVKLERLPLGMQSLRVTNGGLTWISAEALSSLKELYLEEPQLSDARNASLAPPPRVSRLLVYNWQAAAPARWPACGELRMLTLVAAVVRRLPPGWLAGCARLADLMLHRFTHLQGLPERLLSGLAGLVRLEMQYCNITALPEDFFSFTRDLVVVNLSNNLLESLPRKISTLQRLQELNLSNNRLSAPALDALATLHSLRVLELARNSLGDLCGDRRLEDNHFVVRDDSPLSQLTQLEKLDLSRVNATQICDDWRRASLLKTLDLRNNLITQLEYEDLRMDRSDPTAAKVLLDGNPIETIHYDEKNYEKVSSGGHAKFPRVQLRGPLVCDCQLYQFARALRHYPQHVNIGRLRCRGGGELLQRPLEEFACDVRE